MSQLCHSTSWRQNKGKSGGGQFKPAQIQVHMELKILSCCDVGCQNRCSTGSFIAAATARQKMTTAVVKRDKTSGVDRNNRQKCSHLQRKLLIRKG